MRVDTEMPDPKVDWKRAIDLGERMLTVGARASRRLAGIKGSTLCGVTGGLSGITLAWTLNSFAGLPLLPGVPLFFSLGICLGHVWFRGSRGFRFEAEAEIDRMAFDERVRRIKVVKGLASPEAVDRTVERLAQNAMEIEYRGTPALSAPTASSEHSAEPKRFSK